MGILDKKNKIMADIAALNTLVETIPNLKLSKTINSYTTINTDINPVEFLLDLSKSVLGYDELIENITDIITRKLNEIEKDVKKTINKELKELISCSINPSIPENFKSTGPGIIVKISDIDFFGMTKVDPKSQYGKLLYSDVNAGENSKDFNTFLYSNISKNKDIFVPNGGSLSTWGMSTSNKKIMDIKFSPVGSSDNNIIKFNANPSYDNETLYKFNVDYINSISLFGTTDKLNSDNVISILFEGILGTITSIIRKSKKQIENEEKLKDVLDCILNSDEIDDSFFELSNEQLLDINKRVENKKNGEAIIDTFEAKPVTLNPDTLLKSVDDFNNLDQNTTSILPLLQRQYDSVKEIIMTLTQEISENEFSIDIRTVKFNFIVELAKSLARGIMTLVISPKLVSLFTINYQIVYGEVQKYTDPIDFVRKNANLVRAISKSILKYITDMLIKLVLRSIRKKIEKKYTEDEIERAKNYSNQILSLTGLSPDIIKQIQNLT